MERFNRKSETAEDTGVDASAQHSLNARGCEIADQVEPIYRSRRDLSCTGSYAKRWSAAYTAAMIALSEKA